MPHTPEERRAYHRAYRKAHKAEVAAKNRAYNAAHKAELAAKKRAYNAAHKAEAAARSRAYNAAHKEEVRARCRAYYAANKAESAAKHRAYYAAHQVELAARSRAYIAANKVERAAYQRAYRLAHPEQIATKDARRRARKAGASVNDLTAAQWREILAAYGHRCVYCGRKMQRLTQDHVIPLAKGGTHTFSNVVPACRSCNAKKYTGPPLTAVQPLLLTIAASRRQAS